ncbi:MAG TPA: PKD domain-containing protein [Gemmatimonadales bacterium]|nr:PKD domain-containing protein [Gemmatimonadales bacterium]
MLRSTTKVTGLLTAVMLAVSCTESAGPPPEGGNPDAPRFSFSANGITLNREIVTFSQSGRLLIKGFDPVSPHNGDAVVATFYWLGSTNIIDSVVDVMTTNPYTHVGNKYTLVQYVTAGGLSMATYVATNIQNFPDGASQPNPVYAVGAYLRDSVADGGIRLSSWTGVDDAFAQALGSGAGAPRGASGAGTVPTVASAGSIAYNAAALVYGASIVKPPVGLDRDPAFSSVGDAGSDMVMKDHALYAVRPSSGTANPQWTWYFDQQPGGGTWLATTLTLNAATGSPPPPPPTTGDLTVSTTSSGLSIPASYTATVDGNNSKTVPSTGSVTFTGLSSGSHTLVLAVPSNCTVTDGASRTVSVPAGGTATASYTVLCTIPITLPVVNAGPDQTALTGLLYSFNWSFSDAGHDGPWTYTINWGDGHTSSGTVSQEGTRSAGHTYFILLPRSFTITVTVRDAAGNSGSDAKRVSVLLL